MKGISILASLFLVMMLIMVILLVSGLIWVFTEIYGVGAKLGLINPREVTLRIFFKPVEDESVLLSFLECKYNGIQMKRILNAVAIQGTTNIWLDNEFIDAKIASEYFLNRVYAEKGYGYILKISDPEIIIADSAIPIKKELQTVSTKLFLLDGKNVNLQLLVDYPK